MPEENKNQNRDLSQIRREKRALLEAEKEMVEKIRIQQQAMTNENTNNLNQGKQKKLETLCDRFPVFLLVLGLATSGFFAIWLNCLI